MEYNAMYELFSGDFYENLRDIRLCAFDITDLGDRPVNEKNICRLADAINRMCSSAQKMCSLKEEALSELNSIEIKA